VLFADWLPLFGLLIAGVGLAVVAIYFFVKERKRDREVKAELERLSAEHARLADQVVNAEQDERRRLALFLHDGPVQSLSGIALMLDAAIVSVEDESAAAIMRSALEKQRDTIRSLRDLSFELEPVVLRDQGFAPAVRALAEQLGLAEQIEIGLDVEGAETLAQRAQVTIYQIIREALHQAIRRGPPERIRVRVGEAPDGVEAVIVDDAPGERRRRPFEAIEERARGLGGRLEVDQSPGGGTVVRVVFPAYAVRR
jgi:signal transduction histidine kinase